MVSPKFLFVLIFLNLISLLEANSRVAFSRPGNMVRIPSVDQSRQYKLLSLNLSSEILSSSQSNSAFSVIALGKSGYEYGISIAKPVNPANSVELGFHLQKNMFVYGNVNLDIGAHDILFRQGSASADGLDTKGISLFTVISSKKSFKDYTISAHLGFGTGKINGDSQKYISDSEQNIDVFLGFELKTPYLKKNGGINILTEFDGKGLNLGFRVPVLRMYHINFGITNFENFGEFATEDRIGTDYALLAENAPSISLGLTMNVPRLSGSDERVDETGAPLGDGIYAKTDSSILYYDPVCKEIVQTLRDSIRLGKNMIENLGDHNIMLLHNEIVLVDSTRKNLLLVEVSQHKQNEAMRHLSRSLRFFYNERYRDALSEVNTAIEVNPNLAIAYGRRGSIYYKLGDLRRATLNWNVALQLDPEFTEIYNMLKASDENRLKPVEISKNIGENNK